MGGAAAAFAQASLRRARVESNGGYTLKAERVLKAVLEREPGDYDALKMLGAVSTCRSTASAKRSRSPPVRCACTR